MHKEQQCIIMDLTKKHIENRLSLNSDNPVSRQFEETFYGYYGWPTYWGDPKSVDLILVPSLCVTVMNGKNPVKVRKQREMPICAALMM